MTEGTYTFRCLVERDRQIFKVSLLPTDTILDMKNLIHEERAKNFIGDLSPVDITLVKISREVDTSKIQDIISAGVFRPRLNAGDVVLWEGDPVSKVWSAEPKHLSLAVFARLPTSLPTLVALPVPIERALSVESSGVDVLGPTKLAIIAPSQMGKLREYRQLQNDPDTKILDDRPLPDSVPPASLLYHGFGHFLDIFRGHEDVSHPPQWRRNLELAVDWFAEEMTIIHDNEDERKYRGLRALNTILDLDGRKELTAATIGPSRVCSDGHYNGRHDAVACVVEFKNELVDISSIPVVELTSYVAHSHAQSLKRFKKLYRCWRVPCLGMTIVGPNITFHAVIYTGVQWRVVNLTPALSCITSAGEGDDRKALYAAFISALALLRHIDEDTHRFLKSPGAFVPHKYPYVSALPKFGGAPNEKVDFRIVRQHPDEQDHRLIYIAKNMKGSKEKKIMIKFTRQYSIALHAFCAERGHAPEIHGFEKIPGGWNVIAMDFISPSMRLAASPHPDRFRQKWIDDLQKLMESFHEEGLVHGDLREPNILCNGDKVILVDYDWGGKVGEAHYPHPRLCSELRDGRGNNADPKITKEDDKRILGNTTDRSPLSSVSAGSGVCNKVVWSGIWQEV